MKKINSNLFKEAISKYTTGIAIITTNINEKFIGKTVNSFTSLSLTPPLVLFSLDKKSSSLKNYKESPNLGINILARNQKNTANYFSKRKPIWGNTKYFLSTNNIPMIKECVVNIDCKKIKTISQGDHIIFICKVNKILINNIDKPLIYFNSQYI